MNEQVLLFINNTTFYQNSTSYISNFTVDKFKKVFSFHRAIPSYQSTHLESLPNIAENLRIKHIFVKDESKRFSLNSFKVLSGSYSMAKYISKELGLDIAKLPYDVITSDVIRMPIPYLTFGTTAYGNYNGNYRCRVAWTASQLRQKFVVHMSKGSSVADFFYRSATSETGKA